MSELTSGQRLFLSVLSVILMVAGCVLIGVNSGGWVVLGATLVVWANNLCIALKISKKKPRGDNGAYSSK